MSQTRENCCQGKIRHRNRAGAMIALRKFKNAQMNAYECPYCKGWHIGRSNREMKIQARLDQLLGPWTPPSDCRASRPPRG